jgi:hypothetical protein
MAPNKHGHSGPSLPFVRVTAVHCFAYEAINCDTVLLPVLGMLGMLVHGTLAGAGRAGYFTQQPPTVPEQLRLIDYIKVGGSEIMMRV